MVYLYNMSLDSKPNKKSCLLKPAQYQWTILISLVLLFSFFTTPCYARWSWGSKGHGIIKGSVTDSQTNNPLSGVKVSLVSLSDESMASTSTDTGGNYKLSNLSFPQSGSMYILEASKQGYESQSKTVFFKKNETYTFNFRLVFGDIIPPQGTIKINSNQSYTNTTNVTLNLLAQDNAGGSGLFQMKFSNDGQNWSNPEAYAVTKNWTLTTSNGTSHFRKNRAASSTKTAYVKFSDKAGNWSPAFSDTIILDTTPPVISVVPVKSPANQDVTLFHTVTDNFTSQDKIIVSGNDSPYREEGNYKVTLTAKDLAGNISTALIIFTIDKTPPVVKITSPANNVVVNTIRITVSYTVDGIAKEHQVDLIEGTNTIKIEESDNAANKGFDELTVILDTTPPKITIEGINDNDFINKDVTPVINIVDENLDTESITLNGQPFAKGTNINQEGNYTLEISAIDKANNKESKKITFTIDKTIPQINLNAIEDGKYYNQQVTPQIIIIDSNLADQTVTLNGKTFSSGGAIGEEGNYTLEVTAQDLAGNVSMAQVSFTIDKTPPVVRITYPRGNVIVNIFDMMVEYTVDGIPKTKDITLTEGENTITIEESDSAGNIGSDTITVVLDTTSPVAPLGLVVTAGNTVITLNWNANTEVDLAGYNLYRSQTQDGSYVKVNTELITNPLYNDTNLNNGTLYYYVVTAVDARANESGYCSEVSAIPVIPDTIAPQLTIEGVVDGSFVNTDVTPIITVTDENPDTQTITLNSASFVSATAVSKEGTYTLEVSAKDKAGNTTTKSIYFTIDKTLPVIDISGVQNGIYYKDSVTPQINIYDVNLNTTSIMLNGANFVSATAINDSGNYILFVSSQDKAGNKNETITRFVIDNLSPVVSDIPDVTITASGQNIDLDLDDYVQDNSTPDNEIVWVYSGNSNIEVFIEPGTHKVSFNVPNDWNGEETITFTAVDPAGLTAADSVKVSVNIPVTPPIAQFYAMSLLGNSPLGVQFTNSSRGRISSYLWDFGDGGTSTHLTPFHIYGTPGDYTVKLTVTGPGGTNSVQKENYIKVNPHGDWQKEEGGDIEGRYFNGLYAGGIGGDSKPVLMDIDADDDLDMFIGTNQGKIIFYRNEGSNQNEQWVLVSTEYGSIDVISRSSPAFCDIDADGDYDLFVGGPNSIYFYRNRGTAQAADWEFVTDSYEKFITNPYHPEISFSVYRTALTFCDIDADGDYDMFIGNDGGTVSFIRNDGTPQEPNWVYPYSDINVGSRDIAGGHLVPIFNDIDNDGDYDLFVGTGNGTIRFYCNKGTPLSPQLWWWEEIIMLSNSHSVPYFADIDSDGDSDLFIGRSNGAIHFYRNDGTSESAKWTFITQNYQLMINGGVAPVFCDIDDDGDPDLFMSLGQNTTFYRNDGSPQEPNWRFITESYYSKSSSFFDSGTWTFCDIDQDNDFDLFISNYKGMLSFYRNDGTPQSAQWVKVTDFFSPVYVENIRAAAFVDIDNDADFDLFIGKAAGTLSFYRNDGTASAPKFVFITHNYNSITAGTGSSPVFTDIDNDNDYDLLIGNGSGKVCFYRNDGSVNEPVWIQVTDNFNFIDTKYCARPVLCDIDNDGDDDLFAGGYDGGMQFWRRTTDDINTPIINNLADQQLLENANLDNAIELWNHSCDFQTPQDQLTYTIINNTDPGCGVTIDSNRYIDIRPLAGWSGQSDITVRATDTDGFYAQDTFRVTVIAVNDPPQINPAVPDSEAVMNTPIIIDLTAYETDAKDANTALKWTVQGADYCIIIGENSDDDVLTFTPLDNFFGKDTITLILTDSTGLTARQNIVLTWDVAASNTLMVEITSPLNNTVVNTPLIEVEYTANSIPKTKHIQLVEGVNVVRIEETDPTGNTGFDTVVVILDTMPPVVKITAPQNNAVLNTAAVTVEYTVDGKAQTKQVNLSEGENIVTAQGNDTAGNTASDSITVILDTIAPLISVNNISQGDYYNHDLTPVIEITDSNPAASSALLNGQPFSSGTLISQEKKHTLKIDAADKAGNKSSVSLDFYIDKTAPQILSTYPVKESFIPTQGMPSLAVSFVFADNLSGVDSEKIKLVDKDNNDITASAIISPNNVIFTLNVPVSSTNIDYSFTLQLEDKAGNISSRTLPFAVDSSVPVITANPAGGNYEAAPLAVMLQCSEPAGIYYSTDGYPPFEDSPDTIVVTGNSAIVQLNKGTTNLQFFAVDRAGNRSELKREIYYLNQIPDIECQLSGFYNESANRVELQWPPVSFPVKGYYVYRAVNIHEVNILNDSNKYKYSPPPQLRLTTELTAAAYFYDNAPVPGTTYWYGITAIGQDDMESSISQLIAVEVPSTSPAVDIGSAIQRALLWVEANQSSQGYWDEEENRRILATSQVLNALSVAGKYNYWVRRGLFWLRGQFADNNDYLARKILTMYNFKQNVYADVNRLIACSYFSTTKIYGWGTHPRSSIDALTTALGKQALSKYWWNDIGRYFDLTNFTSRITNKDSRYGWVPRRDTSIFVSSLVYHAMEAEQEKYQWIPDSQNPDGSFGSGIIDTAAVLLWIPLAKPAKLNAMNYLVLQQGTNGSWANNDAYVTGLCLEAILKNSY